MAKKSGRKLLVQDDIGKNISVSITRKLSDVVMFKIYTSKEFLEGVETILRTGIKAFQSLTTQNIKVRFKVVSGICRVKCKVVKGTAITTTFPVVDCGSYGKVTLTIPELEDIWDNIKEKIKK